MSLTQKLGKIAILGQPPRARPSDDPPERTDRLFVKVSKLALNALNVNESRRQNPNFLAAPQRICLICQQLK